MGTPLQDVPSEETPLPSGAARGLRGAGSRTLRNTALVVAARVLSQLLTLVTVILMNRHLKPGQFGDFSFVVTVSGLVTVMIDLGFNTLFGRESARRPSELKRYLNNLASAKILFAVPAFVVFAALLWAHDYQSYLAAGFTMMVLASYAGLLRNALYSLQQLRYEAVAIVLESVVLVVAVAAGALTGQGPGYYLWAYVIRWGFSCVFFAIVLSVRRIAAFGWRLEPALIREWFWKGLPFALTFVITSIYFQVNIPILTFVKGSTETGYYSSAFKLFQSLLFIPQTMLSVAFPVLALMHKEDPGRLGWAVSRLAKGYIIVGWPITVGAVMLAHGFRFVYNYGESEPIFRVLSLAIVFMFVNNAFIAALSSTDRQSSFTWAALWSMVVNIGLNAVLIPFFGAMGAASATVLTEVALGVFGWILTARHLSRLPLLRMSWKPVLAGLVMGAALWPLQSSTGAMLVVAVAGGALVYGVVLLALRPFDGEEWQLLRRAVRVRS